LPFKSTSARDAFDPSEPRDPHGEWTSGSGPETAKILALPSVVDITDEVEDGLGVVGFLTLSGRVVASVESESHKELAEAELVTR